MSRQPASTEPDQVEPGGIPLDLQREWNRVAEQLFGSAMSRPDIYQRVTTLIGITATALRERRAGAQELLAACAAPQALMDAVLAGHPGVSMDGLDAAGLVAASCAMRLREVVEEEAALHRKRVLSAAEPNQWVVLDETGPAQGDPYVPYRRLEAHSSTGMVLAVSTRPDDTFTGCVHGVDVGRIDLDSGALGSEAADAAWSVECASAAEREENVARLRRELVASAGAQD